MSKRFLTPPNLPSGSSLPSSGIAGDLFFKSDEAKIYVHDGTQWVIAQGSGGGGGGVTVSATPPISPSEGDYWFDSTTTKSYIYYDSFWVEVGYTGGGYIVSETAPTDPSEGDVWFSSSEGVIYVYYDGYWIDPSTGGAAGVPAGGTTGQLLAKVDGDDYDTEWIDPPQSLPAGGTEGQILVKSTDDDYDTTWADNSAESTFFLVRNNTGSTISKGTLVTASGAEPSGRIDVAPFENTGLQDSELLVMGVATANISSGHNGTVMSFGTLRAIDTRGTSASAIAVGDETWAEGDVLYAHPTVDGKLTKVRPQHDLSVAFITVRHQSAGQLAVRITPGNHHLEWLHDVAITDVDDGETLVYNSATGLWENGAAGSSTTVSTTAPSSPAEGDNWFNSETGQSFIYYDSYWVELGVGPAGPQGPAGDPYGNIDGGNAASTYGGLLSITGGSASSF